MQPDFHVRDDLYPVRTRAMLKLFFVAGSFLVFVLLGCTLLSPPPPLTFVFVGDPQPALLPGASRTFTVTVLDNLNHQPAAYSHIGIALSSYLATGQNNYQKLSSVQTNRTGQFTFTLTLPPTIGHGDQVQIHFHAPDEISGQDVYQPITLIDEIAVTFPAWPHQAARGSPVQLTAQVSDTQQQHPVIGAVITVTQRFYHQESGWEENPTPVATTRTDDRGQIQIPYTIPLQLKAGDQIEIAFQVQSDEHTQVHNQMVLVQPAATIELLGAPYTLVRGAQTILTARVQDHRRAPLADAKVEAWSGGQQLFVGATDDTGVVNMVVQAPIDFVDPAFNINIVASRGDQQAEQSHYMQLIDAPANVLITTDKPIYQPGQIIHVRTLLLNALSFKAQSAAPLHLDLYDSRGNRLIQRRLTSSDFGIASADLELDSQAMSGDYRIDAYSDQGVYASRTITVKPYKLPRFKVEFQGDRTFYQPGETATGEIHAAYFFGKAVAASITRISCFSTIFR